MPTDSLRVGRRLRQLLTLALVLFSCLGVRLWYLQILRGSFYQSLADRNRLRVVADTAAPRGIIYDRRGVEILAANVQAHSIAVIPEELRKHPDTAARLGPIVGRTAAEIRDVVAKKEDRPYVPVTVARGVDMRALCLVEENRTRLPGVVVRSEPIRFYPHGRLASHVLGHVGEISEAELKLAKEGPRLTSGMIIGKTGTEKQYDSYLRGRQGHEKLEVDARGQVKQKLGGRSGIPGASLVLTLECGLQTVAERRLEQQPHPGAIVVMDPRSGELLALASKPDFDPNVFSATLTAKEWRKLADDPRDPLQDRAVASRYPPGSTIKLAVAAAGLQYQALPPGRVHCSGGTKIGNRVFRCWQRSGHGSVDLDEALARSCDVYFYTVGRRLGVDRLAEGLRRCGLGELTGIDLPQETPGIVPTPAWRKRALNGKWYPGDTANSSIGQGCVAATPLQMARLTAVVANGGKLVTPHLVRKIMTVKGEPVPLKRLDARTAAIDPRYLAAVRQGMRSAVIGKRGTAGALAGLPVAVAAKTGSAETRHGEKPHSWVVAFAPYENPRVVVAVIIEHGGHGVEAAVPIAKALYAYLWKAESSPAVAPAAAGD